MKTPKFFYKKISFLAVLLTPFSAFFFILSKIRAFFIKSHKLKGKFVICIGNATVGGAGKTPSAIFLFNLLQKNGITPAFLSKGYGRKTKGFLKVKSTNTVREIGDEPSLLTRHGQVYLFSKYGEVVQNISKIKEDVLILDDGLQNPYLHKNYTILVVDSMLKFGNNLLLPAGPLRESAKSALQKADVIFGVGGQVDLTTKKHTFVLERHFKSIENSGKFIAFAALAVNQKFFTSLLQNGFDVVEFIEYADHHFYTKEDESFLLQKAQNQGARLITTAKDAGKLTIDVCVLEMHFECKQEEDLLKKILAKIKNV